MYMYGSAALLHEVSAIKPGVSIRDREELNVPDGRSRQVRPRSQSAMPIITPNNRMKAFRCFSESGDTSTVDLVFDGQLAFDGRVSRLLSFHALLIIVKTYLGYLGLGSEISMGDVVCHPERCRAQFSHRGFESR